ncbi:MAG: triose-phosphate isomerase [Alphaproteobacteria bacterium]|nr:triose-phosphate isomerase [Alphaproteobacteria bacterium]
MTTAKLIVGNWKMNGLMTDSRERTQKLATAANSHKATEFQMVVCPPATMVDIVAAALKGSEIKWGGQDCHSQQSGAFTGDISAEMLKDLGCSYVIVGHSERRQHHRETSVMVAAKAKAAHAAGLTAIICVGELDHERTAGQANRIVSEQLKASIPDTATPQNTVIAYEPIWAIGTGKTASSEDIRQMHALIRSQVGALPILYGGSVKAANAAEILHIPNVDGVLVGGASLKADEFLAIAQASQ